MEALTIEDSSKILKEVDNLVFEEDISVELPELETELDPVAEEEEEVSLKVAAAATSWTMAADSRDNTAGQAAVQAMMPDTQAVQSTSLLPHVKV